jgi:hypothetical protein
MDMGSTRESVSFPGILRGNGHEANCTVGAAKVSLPGTSVSQLAEYSIIAVEKTLPSGNYELSANGETIPLQYQNGFWTAA